MRRKTYSERQRIDDQRYYTTQTFSEFIAGATIATIAVLFLYGALISVTFGALV